MTSKLSRIEERLLSRGRINEPNTNLEQGGNHHGRTRPPPLQLINNIFANQAFVLLHQWLLSLLIFIKSMMPPPPKHGFVEIQKHYRSSPPIIVATIDHH